MEKGLLIISLDFELHWGVRDKRTVGEYRQNLMGVRDVVPRLLDLFAARNVHATWATVGFLFFETKEELLQWLPATLPRYRDDSLDPYRTFHEVGEDEKRDPFHFAPSLIREIQGRPGQEIGTHTFSHYYCREEGQTETDFHNDLAAACGVAAKKRIEIRSIVFPRNQVNSAYLPICRKLGITSYRGTENSDCYAPGGQSATSRPMQRLQRLVDTYLPVVGHTCYAPQFGDPINLRSSRFLRPHSPKNKPLNGLKLRRILADMETAARSRQVFHLWWHPHNFGSHTQENIRFLDRILHRFMELREKHEMQSCSMRDAAAILRGAECHA